MIQRKKRKYLNISTVVSTISISTTIFINNQIAEAYLKSDGKTRALFGLKELLQFGYQYYVVILGILSLIFAILGIKGNNQRYNKVTTLLLSFFAIAIVFARIWRVFI
jgi:hypothetical membrane protein